jgi:hypothetical protein
MSLHDRMLPEAFPRTAWFWDSSAPIASALRPIFIWKLQRFKDWATGSEITYWPPSSALTPGLSPRGHSRQSAIGGRDGRKPAAPLIVKSVVAAIIVIVVMMMMMMVVVMMAIAIAIAMMMMVMLGRLGRCGRRGRRDRRRLGPRGQRRQGERGGQEGRGK